MMLKAPRPGTVKTRLAAELPGGATEAAAIYRRLAERQWAQTPPDWVREIHFAPAGAESGMRAWLPGADGYFPQPEGDLGMRLAAAAQGAFARGAGSVFLVGGDCPGLNEVHFRSALKMLESGADYVIGPATDGGYTLLALVVMEMRLFDHMPWSTPTVCELTIARAQEAGLQGAKIETLEDVDDLASWKRQEARLSQTAGETRA